MLARNPISHHLSHGPRTTRLTWQGLNLLAIENENVRLVVWLDHGADLIEFRHKASDLDVLWKNPQCWPPVRHALDQPHEGRSEFYDTFHGGWFTSLPTGFFPADYFGAPIGCHGEMHAVPWEVQILEETPDRVRVQFTGSGVRTPWMLTRVLELRSGESFVHWHETLHNRCRERMPAAWLHHPGFGGPMIEGAELICPARKVVTPPSERPELTQLRESQEGKWPLAEEREGSMRDCSQVPDAGSPIEHVVQMTDFPVGWGCLWNEKYRLGFGLRWDEQIFPHAWSWACGGGSISYPLWGNCHTITLQPSTSPLLPFEQLVESGKVLWVEGRGSVTTTLATGYLDTRDSRLDLPK